MMFFNIITYITSWLFHHGIIRYITVFVFFTTVSLILRYKLEKITKWVTSIKIGWLKWLFKNYIALHLYVIQNVLRTLMFFLDALMNTWILIPLSLFLGCWVDWYLLWHNPFDIAELTLKKNLAFLTNPNDLVTYTLIDFMNKILLSVLPISLAFYYFTFNQQRSLSDSSINRQRLTYLLVLFVFSIIFSLLYNFQIESMFDNYIKYYQSLGKQIGIAFTASNLGRVLLAIFLFLVSLGLGIKLVNSMFRNINIRNLLKTTIRDTRSLMYSLSFVRSHPKIARKSEYRRLQTLTESVYQLLVQAVQKNLNEVFVDNYTNWSELLNYFHNKPRYAWNDVNRCMFLMGNNPAQYVSLYKTILKNHLSLTIALYNSHKIREASICVEMFFQLQPPVIPNTDGRKDQFLKKHREMVDGYFSILYELAIFLLDTDRLQFQRVIVKITEFSKREYVDPIKILITIDALIIRVLQYDDLEAVNTLAYAITNIIDLTESNIRVNNATRLNGRNYLIDHLEAKDIENPDVSLPDNKTLVEDITEDLTLKTLVEQSVFILLQAILKSIELSNHKITGFLVRFIVSNFSSEVLKSVFNKFISNKGQVDERISQNNLFDEFKAKYNFNRRMEQYCLEKLAIMLYAQQRYFAEQKVSFTPPQPQQNLVDLTIVNKRDIDYFITNISKSSYGLSFLENSDFMNRVKNELKVISVINNRSERSHEEPSFGQP
jgi:hypothetical protein